MMTFQQLTDTVGAQQIYSGTSVDQATQGALLEWNFDRYLSMDGDDTTTWLRRYRRNLNMLYPIYMDYLRVESVRSNMDPFITEFMERVHDEDATSSVTGSTSKSSTSTGSDSEHTVTDNSQVRTPDLTTTGTNGNTRTDNLRTLSSGTDTGTDTNTHSEDSEDNTQTRAMSIVYPEANMGSIPSSLNGFPSSIDYADGESDTFGKNEHDGNSQDREVRNLANTSDTTQSGTVTDAGSSSAHEGGTDTTNFDGDVLKTSSKSGTASERGSESRSSMDSRNLSETEQGRHESPADILPRAIQAITSTNSIKWLVNSLQLCFDNYAEM